MNLNDVLTVQTVSGNQWRMFAFIIRQLKRMNIPYSVHDGNIYAHKGYADTYPCIVAHMDTVHDIVEDLYPLVCGNKITGFNRITLQQTGIGGDDKVGIYIALKCLQTMPVVKAVFFRDEEVGCSGSDNADMAFFQDCRFVLQCDRKGNSDFIVEASGVKLSDEGFQDSLLPVIANYGYSFAHGAMTDVMQLKLNGLPVACANLSCGYYRPHSADEYVNIDDVNNCLNLVIQTFQNITDTFPHTHVDKMGSCPYDGYYSRYLCPACGSNQTECFSSDIYCFKCDSYSNVNDRWRIY